MIAARPLPPSAVVVGRGRLGRALAAALREAGRPPATVSARSVAADPLSAGATTLEVGPGDTLLLAVRDDLLDEVSAKLAGVLGRAPAGAVALHHSGALGPEALAPLSAIGYSTGSCHPLQTFTGTPADAGRFEGATFAIDGEGAGLEEARRLALSLGGRPVTVPAGARGLYHLAASLGANGLTGLVGASRDALVEAGFTPEGALAALGPLLRSTLEEALRLGPEAALTGPAARGDDATVMRHRRALLAWDASRLALLEALLREQARLVARGLVGTGC